MSVAHHKDLKVWQEGMELAVEVYKLSSCIPLEERFGLKMQLRRAAASIPANISEGAGRGTRAEFARYVAIARGSLSELETHLLLCEKLEYVTREDALHLRMHRLRMMLSKLRRALVE